MLVHVLICADLMAEYPDNEPSSSEGQGANIIT